MDKEEHKQKMPIDALDSMNTGRKGYFWVLCGEHSPFFGAVKKIIISADCFQFQSHEINKPITSQFSFNAPTPREAPPKDTVVMVSNDSKKWRLAVSTGKKDINNKLIIYGDGNFVEGDYDWKPLTKDGKIPVDLR